MIAIGAIIGLLVSIVTELVLERLRQEKADRVTTEDRIQRLVESLRDATGHISEIEREIQERSKLVKKLQSDAEHYKKLVKLNEPEVEAIAQLLRGELQEEGKRSFWKGAALNFLFFVLGAVVSYFLAVYAA